MYYWLTKWAICRALTRLCLLMCFLSAKSYAVLCCFASDAMQCLRKKNLFYCQQLKEILLRIGCPQSVWCFYPSWDWGHDIVEYHQQSSERRYRVYWWFDPKQALSDCQVWACTARSAGPLSKAPRWWRSKCSSQSTCDILVATSIIYIQSGFIMFSSSPFSLELVCH